MLLVCVLLFAVSLIQGQETDNPKPQKPAKENNSGTEARNAFLEQIRKRDFILKTYNKKDPNQEATASNTEGKNLPNNSSKTSSTPAKNPQTTKATVAANPSNVKANENNSTGNNNNQNDEQTPEKNPHSSTAEQQPLPSPQTPLVAPLAPPAPPAPTSYDEMMKLRTETAKKETTKKKFVVPPKSLPAHELAGGELYMEMIKNQRKKPIGKKPGRSLEEASSAPVVPKAPAPASPVPVPPALHTPFAKKVVQEKPEKKKFVVPQKSLPAPELEGRELYMEMIKNQNKKPIWREAGEKYVDPRDLIEQQRKNEREVENQRLEEMREALANGDMEKFEKLKNKEAYMEEIEKKNKFADLRKFWEEREELPNKK